MPKIVALITVRANTGVRTYLGHNSWHMRYNDVRESCGLAVEHLAHDQKVVGSLPSNARWKWCQSHAMINSCTQWVAYFLSSLFI